MSMQPIQMQGQPAAQPQAPQAPNFTFVRLADLPMYIGSLDPNSIRLVGSSIVQELTRIGWAQTAPDAAGRRSVQSGAHVFAVDDRLIDLLAGRVTTEQWITACTAIGAPHVNVAVPIAATPGVGPGVSPVRPLGSGGDKGKSRDWRIGWGIAAILFAIGSYMAIHAGEDFNDHLAGHRHSAGMTETPVDGKANLPSGLVTWNYKPMPHEFEVVTDQVNNSATVTSVDGWGLNHYNSNGRGWLDIHHVVVTQDLDTKSGLANWLKLYTEDDSADAGQPVKAERIKYKGHVAYQWQYSVPGYGDHFELRIPNGHEVIKFDCKATAVDDFSALQQRCNSMISEAVISDAFWAKH
jgi:hypothetical protein